MSKHLLALMLVGVFSLAGLALAQDPPSKDEPPVRLKKRKPRGDDKPMVEPDQPKQKKKENKKDEKKEEQKAEPREAEPVTQQEEEKEVLQRVVTNVQRVGERLAKNDLGEATQQTQRDILNDLESLINRNENPPQGDGQQDQDNGGAGSEDQNDKNQQGGGQQNQKQSRGQKSKGGGKWQKQVKRGQKSQSGNGSKSGSKQQRAGTKPGEDKRAGKDEKAGEKPGGKDGKNGNGGGGGKDDHARNKNADLDKHGVWGHLPQTLRAEMDAYSNPQPFMPKYDDLIKRYYKTISEQGRRKGE